MLNLKVIKRDITFKRNTRIFVHWECISSFFLNYASSISENDLRIQFGEHKYFKIVYMQFNCIIDNCIIESSKFYEVTIGVNSSSSKGGLNNYDQKVFGASMVKLKTNNFKQAYKSCGAYASLSSIEFTHTEATIQFYSHESLYLNNFLSTLLL